MATKVTWLGHNAWSIEAASTTILIDPFLNDSPTAPIKADDAKADFILLSHGHFDHLGDTVSIAKRTGAKVITNYEVSQWLAGQGVAEDQLVGMNTGGSTELPFGRVKATIAHHSSSMPDGSYGGAPLGFLVTLNKPQHRLYFACDTALFLEMKLFSMTGLDLAVVPIGDLYTMGPEDSIEAIKLLNPKHAAPCHFNTWPPIAQDAANWAEQVRLHSAAEPHIVEPGDHFLIGS